LKEAFEYLNLSPLEKEILDLRAAQKFSIKESADLLKIPETKVDSTYGRIIKKLRKVISFDDGIPAINQNYYVIQQNQKKATIIKQFKTNPNVLNEIDKSVFIMFYYEELKIPEICNRMPGFTAGKVTSRLYQLRLKLAKGAGQEIPCQSF
jgi:DNA-directed RNA polymerase specialized sigma24 family protein